MRFAFCSAAASLLLAAPCARAVTPTFAARSAALLRVPQDKDKFSGEAQKKEGKDEAPVAVKGAKEKAPADVKKNGGKGEIPTAGKDKVFKDKVVAPKKPEAVAPKTLEGQWEALIGNDAAVAFKAIWAMVADPERSVPFLSKRLHPVPPPDTSRLDQLLTALDSKRFNDREKAMLQLEKMGAMAKAVLEKALAANPSLEKRRRLEKLLDRLSAVTFSGEDLRTWRALEALEYIGTPAARQVLQRLGKGAPGVWQTEQARAALDRLAKRVAVAP